MASNGLQTGLGKKLSSDVYNSIINSDDHYYIFIGKVTPWSNESSPDTFVDSVKKRFDGQRNILALKKIEPLNVSFAVKKYEWTSGTVYQAYDDDIDLTDTNYYVLVDESRIYMCIYNNGQSESTTKPTHTDSEIKELSDGYKWIFLGVIPEEKKTFITSDYIPVDYVTDRVESETINQYNQQKNSVNGSLVNVTLSGTNTALYGAAYQEGNSKSVSKSNADNLNRLYLDLNSAPDESSTFYNDYDIYISSGRGPEVGQKRRITNYVFESENGPYVEVDEDFSAVLYVDETLGNPDSNKVASKYIITPRIVIQGDGVSADLRAIVGSLGKIDEVVFLDRGKNYTSATAVLVTEPDSGTKPTINIEVFQSGGIGHNIIKDLNAASVMMLGEFDGDEKSVITTSNDIRQFGLIKNPILNDGTNRIAGTEFSNQKTITISKPALVFDPYILTQEDATFAAGKYMIGDESKATAKIVSFNQTPSNFIDVVVEDQKGKFILPDETKVEVRFTFNAATGGDSGGAFIPNETITQYTGTGGTAEGIVTFWDNTTRELEVEVTDGNFIQEARVYGSSSSSNYSSILRLEPKGGELIKIFDDTDADFDFEVLSSTTNIGRIYTTTNSIDRNTRNPIYDLTTKLIVKGNVDGASDTGYTTTPTTFSVDEFILQGNTLGNSVASGYVVEWNYKGPDGNQGSGSTGELVLSGVIGTFITGPDASVSGFSGGNINFLDKFVYDVQQPQVIPTSGDLLYIQNIKDVDRSKEQSEEIRLVLNF